MESYRKFIIMLLMNLLFSLIFVHCNNISDTNFSNRIYNEKRNNKIDSKEIRNSKRKLNYDEIRDINSEYIPLKIYLELTNFNETIPDNLKDSQDIIINAMKTAKTTLEKFILKDCHFPNYKIMDSTLKNIFGLDYWNTSMFGNSQWTEANEEHNLFIFFKFGELSDDNMASSKIVYIDKNISPFAGVITLNNGLSGSKLKSNYLEVLMLHHFTHLLGFHKREEIKDIAEKEEDDDDDDDEEMYEVEYFEGIIKEKGELKKIYYIDEESAPKTIEYANQYFGIKDSDANKIIEIQLELDNEGNIHWPSKLLLGEYMTKFIYPEEQVISKFTLEFLNDLGFIQVEKYYTGGLMRFGKNKGYDFYNENCMKDGIKYENEFYYPNSETDLKSKETSCTSGRLSKAVHKLFKYSNIEGEYPSYSGEDGIYSGLIMTNYCPVSVYDSYNIDNNIYIGRCSEKDTINDNDKNVFGEDSSDHSFCALNSLVKLPTTGNEIYVNKFRAGCFNMYCSSKSLTIQVGEDYLVCPREGGIIEPKNYNGYILCPDYNLICTTKDNKDLCNNLFNCINQEVEEKDDSFDYSYYDGEIKTTQDSSKYKQQIKNNEISYDCSELDESGGKCPQYCRQCKDNKRCFLCLNGYSLLGKNDESETEEITCTSTTLTNGEYYTKEVNQDTNIYYPCINKIDNCIKCSNANTCIECKEKYVVDDNNKCKEIVENCKEYNIDKSCKECKDNYGLIIEEITSCKLLSELENDVNQKYYYKVEGTPDYYVKCSYKIDKCEKCDDENTCKKCINNNSLNYGIIGDDYSQCKDLSTNEYYFDIRTQQNLPCSETLNFCKKCSQIGEMIDCIECDSDDYVLIHDDIDECILKNTIQNDNSNNYFSDDEGNNYYSCSNSLYHSVENCQKCNNKDTCLSCKNGYQIVGSNDLCISNSDLKKNKYVLISGTYKACSEVIKGCDICTNENTCTKCNIAFDLDIDDKCIPTSLALTRYYLDIPTGKYKSCSSTIDYCEECSSSTQCTRCISGYELNDELKCREIIKETEGNENESKESTENNEKNVNEQNGNNKEIFNGNTNGKDKDYDKIKALATGGIVLGSVGTIAAIFAVIFMLLKNILFTKAQGNVIVDANDPANIVYEEPNEVVVQSAKRSIHNEVKNNDDKKEE